MITAIRQDIHRLLDLHAAIGGCWNIEVRHGAGFHREIVLSANTVEDEQRLAEALDIKLGRVLSVDGRVWWSQGEVAIDGIRVRVTGPHFVVVEAVQP